MNQTLSEKNLLRTVCTYARMIKISHTVFALPFALAAAVLAWRTVPFQIWDLFWILSAMVSARSAAMGVNRIADARIDGENPRTAKREIPAGKISKKNAAAFVVISTLIFVFSSAMLGKLCFYLSGPVLFFLFSYSLAKRITWLTHLYLGFAIGLAPVGAWIAVADAFSPAVLWLSLALMTYIAGFDIYYACGDIEFDRSAGLHSIPARFGPRQAINMAAGLHFTAFFAFVGVYFAFGLGTPYIVVILIIGILMVIENRLVRPDDLSRIDIAFFHVNSVISILLLLGVSMDATWGWLYA